LLSCSTDASLKVWQIPVNEGDEGVEIGLTEDLSTPLLSLSTREMTPLKALAHHPSARGIVAARGAREVFLFDLEASSSTTAVASLTGLGDLQSMCWSFAGDLIATTGKDKLLRLIDLRAASANADSAVVSAVSAHGGIRNSRSTWLGDSPFLLTTGHSASQDREVFMWDSRNMQAGPIKRERIDSGTGMLMPFYEPDHSLLVLAGKGDSSIRLYECDTSAATTNLHAISNVPVGDQVRGAAILPKQACDVLGNEVLKMLKLAESSVQPISFVVPRKEKRIFQPDLYPPSYWSAPPATSSSAWLAGENVMPNKIPIATPVPHDARRMPSSEIKALGEAPSSSSSAIVAASSASSPATSPRENVASNLPVPPAASAAATLSPPVATANAKAAVPVVAVKGGGEELNGDEEHKALLQHDIDSILLPRLATLNTEEAAVKDASALLNSELAALESTQGYIESEISNLEEALATARAELQQTKATHAAKVAEAKAKAARASDIISEKAEIQGQIALKQEAIAAAPVSSPKSNVGRSVTFTEPVSEKTDVKEEVVGAKQTDSMDGKVAVEEEIWADRSRSVSALSTSTKSDTSADLEEDGQRPSIASTFAEDEGALRSRSNTASSQSSTVSAGGGSRRVSSSGLGSMLKYRHAFGTENPKAQTHFNLSPATGNSDGPLISCSDTYFAVPYVGGGGGVFVSRLDAFGKVEPGCPIVNGHKSAVCDVSFSPFHSNIMATASNDCTIKIWSLPSEGASVIPAMGEGDASFSFGVYRNAIRTITFHPTIGGLLCSTFVDQSIRLLDIQHGQELATMNLGNGGASGVESQVNNVSYNYDGSLFAVACKDRTVRIADTRSAAIAQSTSSSSSSSSLGRNLRVVWCCSSSASSSPLLTVSSASTGMRTIHLWDSRNLSAPFLTKPIDNASGQLFPMWDEDTSVCYLAGKGDTIVRHYELFSLGQASVAEEGDGGNGDGGAIAGGGMQCEKCSEFQTSRAPIAGICMLPKRLCDVSNVQISRFLKLTTDSVVPYHYTLPRADNLKEFFQDDVFPPTRSKTPSLSAADWLARGGSGDDGGLEPVLESLQPEGKIPLSQKPAEQPKLSKAKSFSEQLRKEQEEKARQEAAFTKLQQMAQTQGAYYSKKIVSEDEVAEDEW